MPQMNGIFIEVLQKKLFYYLKISSTVQGCFILIWAGLFISECHNTLVSQRQFRKWRQIARKLIDQMKSSVWDFMRTHFFVGDRNFSIRILIYCSLKSIWFSLATLNQEMTYPIQKRFFWNQSLPSWKKIMIIPVGQKFESFDQNWPFLPDLWPRSPQRPYVRISYGMPFLFERRKISFRIP